jgi:hypothetical protein
LLASRSDMELDATLTLAVWMVSRGGGRGGGRRRRPAVTTEVTPQRVVEAGMRGGRAW